MAETNKNIFSLYNDYLYKKRPEGRHKKSTLRCFFRKVQTGLTAAQYRETLFEAVNTAANIQHFLLAGVERVTR